MAEAVAHRCNTPEKVDAAVAAGVSWVEIDAAADGSGRLVASHGRVTNGDALPLAEMLGLTASRGVRVTVDLKCPRGMVPFVCEAVTSAGLGERILLSGNYERPWDEIRSLLPGAQLGWSPLEPGRWARTFGRRSAQRDLAASAPALLGAKGLDGLLAHHSLVSETLARALHAEGRHLHAWTVDRAPRAWHLAEIGVDALVTNRPHEIAAGLAADRS